MYVLTISYDFWVAIVFSSPFHWFCYMKGKHLLPFVDIKDTRKWHSCEAWLSMFLIKVNINNCNANTYRSICFLQSFLVPRLLVTCVYGHVLFVFVFITICKNGNKELIIKTHDNKHWVLIHHIACVQEVSYYKHECFIYRIGLKRILLQT